MAEMWKPPPLTSREKLAGLEPAARDAVVQAEEQAMIAYTKAVEAMKHARELAEKAGAPVGTTGGANSSSSSSAEEWSAPRDLKKKKGKRQRT